MKCLLKRIILLCVLLPIAALAGWQVAKPGDAVPREPFFQAAGNAAPATMHSEPVAPKNFARLSKPIAMYAISVSGSLKENVERIMERYHWRVIWKAPYDYNFDGRITGSSLPNVIEKLMDPFPLQATLYMSNHTMTVTTRKV